MLLSQAATASAPVEPAVAETICRVVVGPDSDLSHIDAPDLHVLEQTAEAGRFAPQLPEGARSITCGRTSIVPAPHDDEVLLLGLPFSIVDVGPGDRIGVLEISQGQYRFRMLRGQLDRAETQMLQTRLDAFQERRQTSAD